MYEEFRGCNEFVVTVCHFDGAYEALQRDWGQKVRLTMPDWSFVT